jgi:hypothetical protein
MITFRRTDEQTLNCAAGNDKEARALRESVRDFNILYNLGRPVEVAGDKDDMRISGIGKRLDSYLEQVGRILAEKGVFDVILPPASETKSAAAETRAAL